MRRLPPLLALALATCCPPPKAKAPITVMTDGAGSGSATVATPAGPTELSLASLQVGVSTHGFTPAAVYLDGNDQPIGARFVHDKTKFIFDYLRIESAPQAFIWVNSFPTSNKGEPHTQEHLLLGKGNRGRKMGSFQAMALTESSAFTDQWRTAYHFHTVAGRDTFWPVLQDQLGAMLDADYTDEEIRREVRNFGVDKREGGKLVLEEKGTVYNEMVRAYEEPDAGLWLTARRLVYGTKHPLAYESGGYPDDIRTMTIEDIRKFHADNYHLANMGMIATFPSAMTLTDVLDGTDKVLVSSNQRTGKVTTEADLPPPAPAAAATPVTVDYPYSNDTQASPMMLVWPATRGNLDLTEKTLLDLFMSALAGDESTPLYKKLIDSKTRAMDIGASDVGAWVSGDEGYPIYLQIGGVRADKLDPDTLNKVRAEVMAELQRIANLPDGDLELLAIKQRIRARTIDARRRLAKFLDSPPGFGFRGTSSAWMNHMDELAKVPGARKSLTLKPQLAAVDQLLAEGGNPWRARLKAWGLLEQPFVVAAKPSAKLRKDLDAARDARIAAELARLGTQYGASYGKDPAATLAKYQADYEVQTKILEAAAAATPLPPLVAQPPMTYDDDLQYATSQVAGVPAFIATIGSMQSARVAVSFKLGMVPEGDEMYLAALPELMSQVGIAGGDVTITSEEMRDRLRKEILALGVHFDEDARTGRAELVVAGSGNDATEAKTALTWMLRVMAAPNWRLSNLPRLRDLVDQSLTNVRRAMQGPEEAWVRDPHDAWWRQDSQLHLHIGSFLTQAHDLHRLRWQLLDPEDPKVTAEATAFLGQLAGAARLPRAQLVQLAAALVDPKAKAPAQGASYVAAAAKLSPGAKALAVAAGKDLTVLVPDLPDGSLGADWAYLCKEMAADLEIGAPAALAKLVAVRKAIVQRGAARITAVGSSASHAALAGDIAALVNELPAGAYDAKPEARTPWVTQRLKDHDKTGAPAYVGLFSPATSSGVFINNAPATSLTDTSQDAILDYLASNTFTGHGAHSLFMKTWAAGLAYSNGVHPMVQQGQIEYYAERCPLLPQTMRFVVGQLEAAKPDPNIARYAIAKAFDSRIAAGYEARAQAMADDLADGLTPEVVRAFRRAVLAQADRPDLAAALFQRLPAVYGKVMPGYGKPVANATNFVIGPAKQLDAYQDYLRSVAGKGTVLHRLYPRDFWIPAKL